MFITLISCVECARDADTDSEITATNACPIHPEITGLDGDKCSKCGMDLTLAEANEVEEEHQH